MAPSNRVRAAVVGGLLALAGCADGDAPARPNVLLVVVDTLRADRLGPAHMPRLDAFADEGLRFARVHSPRAKTTPAVASLFTGLYPPQHGVRDLTVPLDDAHPTLAGRLADAGWATGAIVGNFVLVKRRSALDRGFDVWVEDLPQSTGVPPSAVPQRTATSLTDGALVALGLSGRPAADGAGPDEPLVEDGRPWFLYLHYMDPHGAYEPPSAFPPAPAPPDPVPAVGSIPRTRLHRPRVADYNVPASARLLDGGFDAAAVRAHYDAEVRYVDAEIGRLLDALRAAGRLEDTLVIVTADHGESLGEHLYWFEHGLYAYDATCHVPLVVRFPDGWSDRPAPGARLENQSLTDLAPTILDLLGLAPLPTPAGDVPAGRSNAANWLAGEPATQTVYMGKTERADLAGAVQIKAATWRDWKVVRRFTYVDGDGGPELRVLSDELYRLDRDPGETRDLAPDADGDPELAATFERMLERLQPYLDADRDLPAVARELQAQREALATDAAEDVRHLQALGYW